MNKTAKRTATATLGLSGILLAAGLASNLYAAPAAPKTTSAAYASVDATEAELAAIGDEFVGNCKQAEGCGKAWKTLHTLADKNEF